MCHRHHEQSKFLLNVIMPHAIMGINIKMYIIGLFITYMIIYQK